jgi:hypothetical protein
VPPLTDIVFSQVMDFLGIEIIFPGFNLYLNPPSVLAPQLRVASVESTLAFFNKLLYVPSNPWFVRGMKFDCVHWKKMIEYSVHIIGKR